MARARPMLARPTRAALNCRRRLDRAIQYAGSHRYISPRGLLVPRFRGDDSGICGALRNDKASQDEKGQLSLAQLSGKTPLRTDPIPTPGGCGAEESGTERTGQRRIFLSQASGAGDGGSGQQYDSANVPVTRYFRVARAFSSESLSRTDRDVIPVRLKKMRQNKNLEPRPIRSERESSRQPVVVSVVISKSSCGVRRLARSCRCGMIRKMGTGFRNKILPENIGGAR